MAKKDIQKNNNFRVAVSVTCKIKKCLKLTKFIWQHFD